MFHDSNGRTSQEGWIEMRAGHEADRTVERALRLASAASRTAAAWLASAVWLAVIAAGPLAAQSARPVVAVDSLYFNLRPAESLERCDSLLIARPGDFELLWRASRAALVLGILADHPDTQRRMYLRAEELARRTALLDERRVEGHYWLAAAMGRRALHESIITTVRLATAVNDEANAVLAIDSLHAGAHDVLGKLSSEVMNLPTFLRVVAGRVLGVPVARYASWEEAERHLRRAIALDPEMVLYRADLAQLYLRMGRRAEAEQEVHRLRALPRVHPPDALFQREALERLSDGLPAGAALP